MIINHKDKSYWVSTVSADRPSIYAQCKNKYGTEYERPLKKGSKTYNIIIRKAQEK